ncbi:hypothetical protein Fcan01_21132 [Folsomia candida]|uniref:Uncharacterized protein n=1 Tax=Folsomia candida TaxID=158441 RepID=A0A226DFE7_FOLCA|nr:hypothetical protein Fcan01_21132 [Folsomia candida]
MGTTINDITISPGCSPPTDTNSPLYFPQVCPNTELEPLPTPAAPLPANIFVPPHILPSFQPVPPHHTNAFYRPPFPPSHISTIDGDFCACPLSHIDNLTGFTSIQDCNAHPPFVNPRSTNDPHFVSLLAQQLPSQLQQGIGTSDMRPHVVSAGSDSIHMLDAPRPRSSGQHMTFPDSPPTGVDLRIPSTVVAVSLLARMYIANSTSQHLRITGNPGIQNSEAHITYRMVTAVILVEVGESILDDAITPILTDLVVKITRWLISHADHKQLAVSLTTIRSPDHNLAPTLLLPFIAHLNLKKKKPVLRIDRTPRPTSYLQRGRTTFITWTPIPSFSPDSPCSKPVSLLPPLSILILPNIQLDPSSGHNTHHPLTHILLPDDTLHLATCSIAPDTGSSVVYLPPCDSERRPVHQDQTTSLEEDFILPCHGPPSSQVAEKKCNWPPNFFDFLMRNFSSPPTTSSKCVENLRPAFHLHAPLISPTLQQWMKNGSTNSQPYTRNYSPTSISSPIMALMDSAHDTMKNSPFFPLQNSYRCQETYVYYLHALPKGASCHTRTKFVLVLTPPAISRVLNRVIPRSKITPNNQSKPRKLLQSPHSTRTYPPTAPNLPHHFHPLPQGLCRLTVGRPHTQIQRHALQHCNLIQLIRLSNKTNNGYFFSLHRRPPHPCPP